MNGKLGKINPGTWGIVLCCLFMLGANKQCKPDVTDPKLAALIHELNAEWQKGYQLVLEDIGTRHYDMEREVAMKSMRQVLQKLGFKVINNESDYYLYVVGAADAPFEDAEWRRGRKADEPLMKDIAARHLGIKGRLAASLQADGLDIHGTVTVLESNGGVDIMITFRLVEIKPQPPESILPRRDYPPPQTTRIVYEKIWRMFEDQALPLARMRSSSQ